MIKRESTFIEKKLAEIHPEHHCKKWFCTVRKQWPCFDTDCSLLWHLSRENQENSSKSLDKRISQLVINMYFKKQSDFIAQKNNICNGFAK